MVSKGNSNQQNGMTDVQAKARRAREIQEQVKEKLRKLQEQKKRGTTPQQQTQQQQQQQYSQKHQQQPKQPWQQQQQQQRISQTKPSGKIKMDEKGNLVDEQGNIVDIPSQPVRTIKANRNRVLAKKLKSEKPPDLRSQDFFDPRVGAPRSSRSRKSFVFHKHGDFIKKAEAIRSQAAERQFLAQYKKKTGAKVDEVSDKSATSESVLTKTLEEKKKEEKVPDVEWWDAPLLPNKQYNDIKDDPSNIKHGKITIYVQHPVPLEPVAEKKPMESIPLYMTKKERKKLSTKNRIEREKKKQEAIQLGLREPDQDKVSLRNIMSVLGSQSAQDPTKVEAMVRKQMEDRKRKHEEMNQQRKLSDEERRKKRKRKVIDFDAVEVKACLFRITGIPDPQKKFKIDKNARQLELSGCVVVSSPVSIIVAEGNPKAMRKFEHLLLDRIDWNAKLNPTEDDENSKDRKEYICKLVWEGVVKQRQFHNFRFQKFPSEQTARKYLQDHECEHYFDMALADVSQDEPQF